MNDAVAVAADEHGVTERRNLPDEELAGLADLVDATDPDPRPLEDRFELLRVDLRPVVDVGRDRAGAELGMSQRERWFGDRRCGSIHD